MAGPAAACFAPSVTATPMAAAASPEPPVIGKQELLLWISDVLGDIGEDVDFGTLRFGHVFLRLFEIIWPGVMKTFSYSRNLNPRTPADVAENWKIIEEVLQRVEVPLSFINQSLIRVGNFRACYQSLVFLFFLYCLARDHECEFMLAHSVDNELTEFMSSGSPLACLISGGSIDLPPPLKEKILTPRAATHPTLAGIKEDAEAGVVSNGKQQVQSASLDSQISLDGRDGFGFQVYEHQKELQQANGDSWRDAVSPLPKGFPKAFAFRPTSPGKIEQHQSSPPAQQTAGCMQRPRIVGGAFTSDGTFCAGRAEPQLPQDSFEKQQQGNSRKDAHVQTLAASHLDMQEWQLPPPHTILEWCGEGQKLKGEQLIEMLRYQNELLKQQLGRAAEEAAALRRLHERKVGDLKEAAAVELQRVKEKTNADLLEQQAKHASAIQAMRHQLDMRIRQIEDDVTIDTEVLCASTTIGNLAQSSNLHEDSQQGEAAENSLSDQDTAGSHAALAKVKKLQELMEERLRAREAAANEMKQLLQETLEQCATYRRESNASWSQWRRCEDLKESLLQLIQKPCQPASQQDGRDALAAARQALNDEVQKLLDQSGFPIPQISALEHKLLAALVESLCMQRAQHAKHRQEEIELSRLLHQAQKTHGGVASTNGGIATIQKELLLEEQLRRLETQNQRLMRTSEYLRLKVEHLGKWRAEDASFIQQHQEQRQGLAATSHTSTACAVATKNKCATGGEEAGDEGGEFAVSPILLQENSQIIERDSELLHMLKTLGRPVEPAFGDTAENEQNESARGKLTVNGIDFITIPADTKKRLLQLFWQILGDFYKFKSRLEEGSRQLRHMEQLVRTTMKQKRSVEQAAEKDKAELVCSFEKRIQKERNAFQKTIGRTLVKLFAAQEQVDFMQKLKNKHEDEHEALLQVLHQADNKRFNTILAKLHSVEMMNRVMQKREHFWKELAKALSMQLSNPSDKTQLAIQDLWSQLMGSAALIADDIMELSSDNMLLKLNETGKEAKEASDTPRSSAPRSARSSFKTASVKPSAKLGTRLNPKQNSNSAATPKAAGKPCGSQSSSLGPPGKPTLSVQQPSGDAPDSWSPSNSFAKCLKEICGNTATTGDGGKHEPSGSCATSFELALQVVQTTSDSEDETGHPQGAISQQLLSWHGTIRNESGNGEKMPKDWLDLLKLMAKEATALFRKHKALKDEEVEHLKREKETQIDKCKKLMLQLSDQQTLSTSFREQQDFFRQQHQLALQSLERMQQEKASLEEAYREMESALRREAAELRIGHAELQKVISAIASHSSDIPYILTLCVSHGQMAAASPSQPEAEPAAAIREEVNFRGQAAVLEAGDERLKQQQSSSAESDTPFKQTTQSASACRQAEAPSARTETLPTYQQLTPVSPVEQNCGEGQGSPALPAYPLRDSLRSNCPMEARAASDEAVSCRSAQTAPTAQATPASQSCRGDKSIQPLRNSVGNCCPVGGASNAPSMCPIDSEISSMGDRGNSFSWGDEINYVSSTTLPSPQSPPRAALAPLVSPSKLVQALRMHARTPKGESGRRSSNEATQGTNEPTPPGSEPVRTLQTAHSSCSYKESSLPCMATLHKCSDAPDERFHLNSTAQQIPTEDTLLKCMQNKPVKPNPVGSLCEQREMSNEKAVVAVSHEESCDKYQVGKEEAIQNNKSRAAAEQAWEEFVGTYGHPSRKQYESSFLHRRVDGWNSMNMERQRGFSPLESQSDNERVDYELQQTGRGGTRRCRRAAFTCGTEDENISLTRETTDSALQDVLNIEQSLKENLRGVSLYSEAKPNLKLEETEEAFISDDTNQLGISATTFLRRFGSQLETRMRVTSNN